MNFRERNTLQEHAYNSGEWVENITKAVSDVLYGDVRGFLNPFILSEINE